MKMVEGFRNFIAKILFKTAVRFYKLGYAISYGRTQELHDKAVGVLTKTLTFFPDDRSVENLKRSFWTKPTTNFGRTFHRSGDFNHDMPSVDYSDREAYRKGDLKLSPEEFAAILDQCGLMPKKDFEGGFFRRSDNKTETKDESSS